MNADASALSPALLERQVKRFVIDSRETQAGDCFFALSQPEYKENGFNGDFEDSTKFVVSAFEKGAVTAVVRKDRFEEHRAELEKFQDKILFVNDAIFALQRLAHGVYLEWGKPVVAVTGSAGKTTAKELTAHVLSGKGLRVLKNIKNYNNGLGHPLTVLRLAENKNFDAAVLEMGMSTPLQEIKRLCRITPPDFAVALNVLPVHVEHLGSIERVAEAKAELIEGMKPDGTAVLNADDKRVLAMSEKTGGKILTYGVENTADVCADEIETKRFGETTFRLNLPSGSAKVEFSLNGKHNISNALAASAVGFLFGMTAQEIADALKTVQPPPQRGEVLHFKEGFTVINDSYNSNPDALVSMVKMLVEGGNEAKRKIVVAGEMLELGAEEKAIHRATGETLAESGIDFLIGVRGLANETVEAAKGKDLEKSLFFENSEKAGEFLASEVKSGDLILVKGSRGVRTENVIEKLLEKFEKEK